MEFNRRGATSPVTVLSNTAHPPLLSQIPSVRQVHPHPHPHPHPPTSRACTPHTHSHIQRTLHTPHAPFNLHHVGTTLAQGMHRALSALRVGHIPAVRARRALLTQIRVLRLNFTHTALAKLDEHGQRLNLRWFQDRECDFLRHTTQVATACVKMAPRACRGDDEWKPNIQGWKAST